MALRVLYFQLFNYCARNRFLKHRSLFSHACQVCFAGETVRTMRIDRPSTWCFRCGVENNGLCRRYSTSSAGKDNSDDEDGSKLHSSGNVHPKDTNVNAHDEIKTDPHDAYALSSSVDVTDTTDSDHSLENGLLENQNLSCTDAGIRPDVDSFVDDDTSDLGDRDTCAAEYNDSFSDLQPTPSSSSSVSEQEKPSTVDLSHFPRSEDGAIVIYPDIHFNQDTRNKPEPSEKNKQTGYDLQSLLRNIQRSRAEKKSATIEQKRTSMMNVEELVQFLREENGKDICVIELSPELDYVKYFVICSGMGSRHIGRMADNLVAKLIKVRVGRNHRKLRVEGRESEDWMAVDLGAMVVHFMLEDTREKYELEKLWTLGGRYDDQYRSLRMSEAEL